MLASGIAVSETIELRRVVPTRVVGAIATAIAADATYVVSVDGGHTLLASRVFRPTWALVCGWVFTIGLLGAGFWLFFIKRTESCSIAVIEERASVKVTITGRLRRTIMESIRQALEDLGTTEPIDAGVFVAPSGGPAVSNAPVAAIDLIEPGDSSALNDHTIHRSALHGLQPSVRFDTGAIAVVDGVIVIGREPVAQPGDGAEITRVRIADPATTVSKTHFAIGADASGLWIEDRHSTNGTSVVASGGLECTLVPGERVALAPGDEIRFGDRRAEVLPAFDRRPQGSAPHSP